MGMRMVMMMMMNLIEVLLHTKSESWLLYAAINIFLPRP